jgi:hypothetical protein
MDRQLSEGEMKALDNLKAVPVYENTYWRLFEEKGNGRVWAQRKVALTNFAPVDYTEPQTNKRRTRL